MELEQLCRFAVESKASDLFIKALCPPALRVHGRIRPTDLDPLTLEDTEQLAHSVMTGEHIDAFKQYHELDLAFTVGDLARFRCNVYMQRGSYAMVLRIVPLKIDSIDDLGLPKTLEEMAKPKQGLVLVTGPTGCGKSTTLAAMIDLINTTRGCHIVTLEDPIEFLHRHRKSIVNQREIGSDTQTYASGLRSVLRQDPDVILIGEMRDPESIAIAITAAETGHLVFSTLHTIGAAKTLDRIIDVFPPYQQAQVRVQLSMALQSVVSQQLLPTPGGRGRVAAVEVMIATSAIRNLIREGKTPQINNAIQTSGMAGMQTMDAALASLYKAGRIALEDCIAWCVEQENVRRLLNMM
jgi:twitching motility protein PilT